MSVRTIAQVNQALAADLIWRKRELTTLRLLIDSHKAKPDKNAAYLRGSVTLLYAHWEGFVKFASNVYLEYIRHQHLRYDQIKSNFVALSVRSQLRAAEQSKRIRLHLEVTDLLINGRSGDCIIPADAISTRSNLTSSTLRDIIHSLGLDFRPYETKANLIDERLVGNRNTVAHGEYLQVTHIDVLDLYDEVVKLIEEFRTQIDNAASTGAFRL